MITGEGRTINDLALSLRLVGTTAVSLETPCRSHNSILPLVVKKKKKNPKMLNLLHLDMGLPNQTRQTTF